jgi:hypothetical protein
MIEFDLAFIEATAEMGIPVGPVVYCAAVGNIHENDYHFLNELGRQCAAHNGLMGYHNYWWANRSVSGLESWWPWHAGRWQGLDEHFRANGINGVRYFGGESGAVGSQDGYHLLATEGWRSNECYGGNWDRYLADILEADRLTNEWNRIHGGRYLGSTLFTTGAHYTGWEHFQIKEPQMLDIAAALKQRYGG